jgi:hypothetical protein
MRFQISDSFTFCLHKLESADIDYSDQHVLSILQPAIVAVQSTIDKFEGAVARLLADDKGTRFKIAFGMPSCQHEGMSATNYTFMCTEFLIVFANQNLFFCITDDAERVVRAALEIQDRLGEFKISSSIGIACGVMFCGEAGSSMRCEVGFDSEHNVLPLSPTGDF